MDQAADDLISSVGKYSKVGIWLCQGQTRLARKTNSKPIGKLSRRSSLLQQPLPLEETLWVELIEAIVSIARTNASLSLLSDQRPTEQPVNDIGAQIRLSIQEVFTALLASTTTSTPADRRTSDGADLAFLRILRTFLSNAAKASPSLAELRQVITSIFSAYAHEQSLLSLSNAILDKDVFVHLDEVKQLRQQGWRPKGQVCEVCRRRVWGPGLGAGVWEGWQEREMERQERKADRHTVEGLELADGGDVGKGKGVVKADHGPELGKSGESSGLGTESAADSLGAVVVFSCRHIYHRRCLMGEGELQPQQRQAAAGQLETAGEQDRRLACPACIASRP
ncbi:uncharacterized protein AB675_2572 [Cyphellophora attinorum]|uniref:Uncharacterized protein n=1 Tax=Cyphellophora attinorum TaxID=1664694 RepID=A0A0N1HGN1_9EURO|nr:uncharacterized protein AB675_2572 [Phialophora attinorum]KPI44866.1 hypothetical protein AB675_2572 [Phialophora attinorum]